MCPKRRCGDLSQYPSNPNRAEHELHCVIRAALLLGADRLLLVPVPERYASACIRYLCPPNIDDVSEDMSLVFLWRACGIHATRALPTVGRASVLQRSTCQLRSDIRGYGKEAGYRLRTSDADNVTDPAIRLSRSGRDRLR